MRAFVYGFSYSNEMFSYAVDYFKRNRLAKMGFTSPLDSMDAHHADMLLAIESAHNKVQQEKLGQK